MTNFDILQFVFSSCKRSPGFGKNAGADYTVGAPDQVQGGLICL